MARVRWFCRHCSRELHRGLTAVVCDDPEECTAGWFGQPCGYIVCVHCRRPAAEVRA